MKKVFPILLFLSLGLFFTSCVSKKQYSNLQTELERANKEIGKCGEQLNDYMNRLSACQQEKTKLEGKLRTTESSVQFREEQINDLKEQLADVKKQRDKQLTQVGDLTVLSQSANENIKETLGQLEKKDKYIRLLQAAKTKADSINLALAVNLKSVLRDGIEDEDVEIKVDKTVVFINLSDRMLFQSGSYNLTDRANEVLGKIAQIVESKPDLEVMVEGYTDNVPIKNVCIEDNWDLSVKRATSVVRALQNQHEIDPNRLIAAGRGEYNALATNDTAEGRSTNRRTRIIILPKLNQFYDLLNPKQIPD
jgi:chemotaxis protein MotB